MTFYKPQGNLNQHAGYASVAEGDAHIADLVAKLRAGPQWSHMVIVITYDEFGGAWDHVAPPQGDLLGPGARIPALIISPFAKRGTVDHTQYDTESILRLITRRFDLECCRGSRSATPALARAWRAADGRSDQRARSALRALPAPRSSAALLHRRRSAGRRLAAARRRLRALITFTSKISNEPAGIFGWPRAP